MYLIQILSTVTQSTLEREQRGRNHGDISTKGDDGRRHDQICQRPATNHLVPRGSKVFEDCQEGAA